MPTVAILDLVHFRVALIRTVDGRSGCRYRVVDHGSAVLTEQDFVFQHDVDGYQNMHHQVA